MTRFNTAYDVDYDPMDYATVNDEPSMTKQSFKDEADVNFVLGRYDPIALAARMRPAGSYADVSGIGDYQDALQTMMDVEQQFQDLPPEARAEFAGLRDFLNAAMDPRQTARFEAVGLLTYPDLEESGEPSLPGGDDVSLLASSEPGAEAETASA
ncbi:internal scaffolding protein [Microviridae sp.]|nr:internal scaffolding protein [Microviridae sp.]